MDPTSNIGYLLQHLSGVLAKQSDQVLQESLGIGFSQLKILMCLNAQSSTQQRFIAENLGQTEASISRQIKLMHTKGLLKTTVSSKDRRVHITTPTAKGIRTADKALRILNDHHAPLFDRLSGQHQQQLLDIFTLMHEYSCGLGKTGACQKLYND